MKILKIAIILLVVVIASIAVRNKILLDRCARSVKQQQEERKQADKGHISIHDAVIKAQTASIMHLGKTIELVHIEKIFPKTTTEEKAANHPRLMLIFSELSCNVCQDEETRFAVRIASEYGTKYVMAIVHATNRRYVQNYIRLNQVNFPVFYCEDKDNSFFKDNDILNTPMVFVIDEDNQVIAANYPIPGHLEYSKPMHRFCYDYFDKIYGSSSHIRKN
jgi:hypothetical protein